jgi:hypothetical protein
MPFLVQLGAAIVCAHGGQAEAVMPQPRVTLSGQPVVPQTSPMTVAGCPNPQVPPGPCVSAQWLTGSTRVKVMGIPVVLQDSQALTSPPGVTLEVLGPQARVQGI